MPLDLFDPTALPLTEPFLKWAGGKRALLPQIAPFLPPRFRRYHEPFLGGGALFFALASHPLAPLSFMRDTNNDLVITYQVVRDCLLPLVDALKGHAIRHSEEYFYEVRSQHDLTDSVDIAARFIYLNKTCFNGLYRVNRQGRFNVSFGRYANPRILDYDKLCKASLALKTAQIGHGGFQKCDPEAGDFVYCDPPYVPVSPTANFTGYGAEGFGDDEQLDLRQCARRWHERGALVMLSNSDTPRVRELYSAPPFRIHTVEAGRAINSRSDRRGKVRETLITTYPVPHLSVPHLPDATLIK